MGEERSSVAGILSAIDDLRGRTTALTGAATTASGAVSRINASLVAGLGTQVTLAAAQASTIAALQNESAAQASTIAVLQNESARTLAQLQSQLQSLLANQSTMQEAAVELDERINPPPILADQLHKVITQDTNIIYGLNSWTDLPGYHIDIAPAAGVVHNFFLISLTLRNYMKPGYEGGPWVTGLGKIRCAPPRKGEPNNAKSGDCTSIHALQLC